VARSYRGRLRCALTRMRSRIAQERHRRAPRYQHRRHNHHAPVTTLPLKFAPPVLARLRLAPTDYRARVRAPALLQLHAAGCAVPILHIATTSARLHRYPIRSPSAQRAPEAWPPYRPIAFARLSVLRVRMAPLFHQRCHAAEFRSARLRHTTNASTDFRVLPKTSAVSPPTANCLPQALPETPQLKRCQQRLQPSDVEAQFRSRLRTTKKQSRE